MKTQLFENWDKKFQLMLTRFPFAMLFILGTAVLCCLHIHNFKIDIDDKIWAFFIAGVFLNIAAALLLEDISHKIFRYLIKLLVIGIWALFCLTLPKHLQPYQYYQLVILGGVFGLAIFFSSFLKKDNEVPFWNFSWKIVQQLFISYFFAAVLMGGISLAIFSIHQLFHVYISDKVYGYLSVTCFTVFAPIYFLATLPSESEKRSDEITFNKLVKIFGLYILLPILITYIVILYVYLIQIIFKWELPNGWVSTLVSVLGLGGFITAMILFPLRIREENKIAVLLSRYFPVLLFPLLVLMLVGIVRRFDDYGITINRGYVLILNFWLFGISLYQFFIKGKKIKWIFISFAVVAFLVSIGPWSVSNLTRHSLNNVLVKELISNHLISNGKLIQPLPSTVKIDTLSERKIVSSVKYLNNNYGTESLQPIFGDSIQKKSTFKILAMLGIDESKKNEETQHFHAYCESNTLNVTVGQFRNCMHINNSEIIKNNVYEDSLVMVTLDETILKIQPKKKHTADIVIPLKTQINKFIDEDLRYKDNEYSPNEMVIKGTNYTLFLQSVSGNLTVKTNTIKINNLEAFILY